MKVIQKKFDFGSEKNADLYVEKFNDYKEFDALVEERMEKVKGTGRHFSGWEDLVRCNGAKGSGVKSFEEAKNLLLNGYSAKVEKLKNEFEKEVSLCTDRRSVRFYTAPVGFAPIVPNAIRNLPNCMLNMVRENKKSKIVKFLIELNRSWDVTSNEIIDKMSKVLARIAVMEQNGYRCRIEVMGTFVNPRTSYGLTKVAHTILIKSETQPFDIKKIAFPMVHTAMQRVFSWGWHNSLPLEYRSYYVDGLGQAPQYWNERQRNDFLNAVRDNGEKSVFVSYNTDLDTMFGKGGEAYGQ